MCAGRYDSTEARGEVGEELLGVPVAEFMGEVCCDRELYRVYCEGDAANCCTGIAKSVAIAV